MTQAGAGVLADAFYWERQNGDGMAPGSDISVIDWSWTSGGGIMEIQRRLGFTGNDVDGIIGPLTLARINARARRSSVSATRGVRLLHALWISHRVSRTLPTRRAVLLPGDQACFDAGTCGVVALA